MNDPSAFWDALAPHHWRIEDSYFRLSGLGRILAHIETPVLVVGAGQWLIVEALQKRGLACLGVDLSAEMVRYAASRRGLTLVRADARALPFSHESFRTVLFATGVIDFINDERAIRSMLGEGRRVLAPTGKMFVAFYRLNAASEEFLEKLGLLHEGCLQYKDILEFYRRSPADAVAWIGARAGVTPIRAAMLSLRCWAWSTLEEKRNALRLQRVFANRDNSTALLESAPASQPYRTEADIRRLFARLGYGLQDILSLPNCHIVHL